MKEAFDKLLKQVAGLAGDAEKAADGNKSAGVRLREGMQQTKVLAQEVRVKVLASYPATKTKKEEVQNDGHN
jgi:hypothetical protein